MNTITKREFELLTLMEKHKGNHLSQRRISQLSGMSLATVNKLLSLLAQVLLLDKDGITEKGLESLEPYRTKKAIILAAGFGSRLVPITLNTPKPLIRVNGIRIIDTIIDALHQAEIEDITIVRGYLGEQFDQLLYKYPKLKFVENANFNSANNISSAVEIRNIIDQTYILEADIYIYNPKLIKKYNYNSFYVGIATERTEDRCFEVEKKIIKKVKIGGFNCHQLVGISHWTTEDGRKLNDHILETYEMPGGRERYWDEVALTYFASEYSVGIQECKFEDVVEIDTYDELKAIDATYC